MSQSGRNGGPTFNIGDGFAGVINIANRDVRDTKNIVNRSDSRPSDGEVLSAVEALLGDGKIPWDRVRLVPVREEFERAVLSQDAKSPAFRRSVSTFLKVASELGLGVSGNAVSELLKHFWASRSGTILRAH